jgi:hypothetical protein
LGDLVKVLESQVRSSDIVGLLGRRGAGVLLPGVTPAVADLVLQRLSRAARERFDLAVNVGAATIGPSPEPPEAVIERAVLDARHRRTSR